MAPDLGVHPQVYPQIIVKLSCGKFALIMIRIPPILAPP
ncbi:hypothetical protein LT85_3856 [Collimonas arenae]|uniref:Uncharacterized protein n=1 Tax=Collimonas arenae TaxID=279058 RepID=A0A0A1FH97_9BURK|nr:hypothetical protein LT85_3856 [Collimonas arenae]